MRRGKKTTGENLIGNTMACLDTSVVISILKGDDSVRKIVEAYRGREDITTTIITEYELLKHESMIKREIAQELINSMLIYNFDSISAVEAARLFRELTRTGKPINENDILIAGIAIANNELLITRDGNFKNIKDIRILVI